MKHVDWCRRTAWLTPIVPLLPGKDPIGPLIALRIPYSLVPLAAGCALLAGIELRQRLHAVRAER
jgi:hypothetical protein